MISLPVHSGSWLAASPQASASSKSVPRFLSWNSLHPYPGRRFTTLRYWKTFQLGLGVYASSSVLPSGLGAQQRHPCNNANRTIWFHGRWVQVRSQKEKVKWMTPWQRQTDRKTHPRVRIRRPHDFVTGTLRIQVCSFSASLSVIKVRSKVLVLEVVASISRKAIHNRFRWLGVTKVCNRLQIFMGFVSFLMRCGKGRLAGNEGVLIEVEEIHAASRRSVTTMSSCSKRGQSLWRGLTYQRQRGTEARTNRQATCYAWQRIPLPCPARSTRKRRHSGLSFRWGGFRGPCWSADANAISAIEWTMSCWDKCFKSASRWDPIFPWFLTLTVDSSGILLRQGSFRSGKWNCTRLPRGNKSLCRNKRTEKLFVWHHTSCWRSIPVGNGRTLFK